MFTTCVPKHILLDAGSADLCLDLRVQIVMHTTSMAVKIRKLDVKAALIQMVVLQLVLRGHACYQRRKKRSLPRVRSFSVMVTVVAWCSIAMCPAALGCAKIAVQVHAGMRVVTRMTSTSAAAATRGTLGFQRSPPESRVDLPKEIVTTGRRRGGFVSHPTSTPGQQVSEPSPRYRAWLDLVHARASPRLSKVS